MDRDEFIRVINEIYSKGNINLAYDKACNIVGVEKDQHGNILTWEELIRQYKAHHLAWQKKYSDRDPRYIGSAAEEERKTILDFLINGLYKLSYREPPKPRDNYLFPSIPEEQLLDQLKKFKEKYKIKKL